MGVLGTGVAAGVAQTTLQAQQTARERDRKKAHEAQAARKVRESFEAHLSTLEKIEQVEQLDPLQVDEHLLQHHTEPTQAHLEKAQGDHVTIPVEEDRHPGVTPAGPVVTPDQSDHTLYHHIDIEG